MTLRLITYTYLIGQAVYGLFVAFDRLLDNEFIIGDLEIPRELVGSVLILSSILALGFRVPERYRPRHLVPIMFVLFYRIAYIFSLPDRGKSATITYIIHILVILLMLAYAPYNYADTDHHTGH